MGVVLILILVIVAISIAMLVWRFVRGDASEAGGSFGRQFFGRRDDDWGPKSDT
jgi:hypothetical protein